VAQGIEHVTGATELQQKLTALEREVFPHANARAMNRVGDTIKARSAKDIAEVTGLKQGSVRRRIVYRKRATVADASVVLEISGKPLNLVEFVSGAKSEPRSPRGGIAANAWGNRRKYPGVFLARMPNGQVIAVQRSEAGRARRKLIASGKWAGKSPHIKAVFGAGIAREAAQPALTRARAEVVAERYPIELKHELEFAVKRLVAKRVGRKVDS
jgi:hypothetical protein